MNTWTTLKELEWPNTKRRRETEESMFSKELMETRLTSFCSRFGNQKTPLRGSQVQRLRKPNIIPKTRSSCLSLSQTSRTMRFWSNHSSAAIGVSFLFVQFRVMGLCTQVTC